MSLVNSDGEQLPQDREYNAQSKFESTPTFSLADYYDKSRNRSYACCFSLEESEYIWRKYGKSKRGKKGKICLVFDFSKIRETFNKTLLSEEVIFKYNGHQHPQIFSINYGIVNYKRRNRIRLNEQYPPNPIEYTYLKDMKYSREKELRISLAAFGIGQYPLVNGGLINFPPSLFMHFDFRSALLDGTLKRIITRSRIGRARCKAYPLNPAS
jgi:hypothetical protein